MTPDIFDRIRMFVYNIAFAFIALNGMHYLGVPTFDEVSVGDAFLVGILMTLSKRAFWKKSE